MANEGAGNIAGRPLLPRHTREPPMPQMFDWIFFAIMVPPVLLAAADLFATR